MSIPSGKMLAAVLYGPRDVRMEEVDVPRIGPGEILAKVEAASVDFTDWKVFLRGQHPMMAIPGLFGHEWAGTIVKVGEAVSGRWQPGMRVVAANSAPCLPD
ncbi:MAG: alcohol dehydrogenase catalytic domain-containing protein, partial [Candidatus Methylomirabilales bacterium]